jgi:hypothetical protein
MFSDMTLPSAVFVFLGLAALASADCSRDLLKNTTDQYVMAQSMGQHTFSTLSGSVNYTENEQVVDITKGVLTQPLQIDHNRSIHDPVLCATFTELIVTDPKHPYVIGTRMLLTDGRVTTMESVVTDVGDWAFNATGYAHWNTLEKWDPIPAESRDSRKVIQAAGDAYFDRFANASVIVPWGPTCERLEGGAYTDSSGAGGNTCSLGLPSTITVTNRRYVVDEEMGTVDIFLGFPGLDRSVGDQPMPDSHLFRVEGGKIRYIHTVSSCVHAGCGMNGTFPGQQRRLRSLFAAYL